MKISIGILAYNEANCISATLQSLFAQSVFQAVDSNTAIEVVVVPNGCTDETAEIARTTLQNLVQSTANPAVSWNVCEVKEPGKPNAWNNYVHNFSDPGADYIFLMDADIQFLAPTTLHSMVEALEVNANAWVSVDTLVKDVALKEKKSLVEKLSLSVSKVSGAKSVWICGQLYCARAAVLHRIWMPKGIEVEDGFLWKMVVTNLLTSPEVPERVVRAQSASHIFEAYTDIRRLLRHEQWLILANTINTLIYEDLQASCNQQQDAGAIIKSRNEQDPLWVSKLIQANVSQKSGWVIPAWLLLRRFNSLLQLSLHKAVLFLPVAVTAFCVDLLVCLQANDRLHKWEQYSSNKA
ncbi:glycosyltransferase [Calothrix membranacea FACHB-236]|nr:glycosyltransferase [Calothrix membranacea FACHB-236]